MLTNEQKGVLRIIIQSNCNTEYMKKLSESDEFALAEIAEFKARRYEGLTIELERAHDIVADITNQISLLDAV